MPVDALHPFYTGIQSYQDLPPILRDQIAHFFQHYKDLEKTKWGKVMGWGDAAEAAKLILEGMEHAKSKEL